MMTLQISLPESLRDFVERQVAEGGYQTASEYVQDLVRGAQKQQARAKVEALLEEGFNSGEPTEMTREDWENLHRRVAERLAQRNGQ